tara:strand:- start:311 stop:559 length:249 start_codon:yes stop_codon:yes gene_type:complete
MNYKIEQIDKVPKNLLFRDNNDNDVILVSAEKYDVLNSDYDNCQNEIIEYYNLTTCSVKMVRFKKFKESFTQVSDVKLTMVF